MAITRSTDTNSTRFRKNIASNNDYIPLYGESYPTIVHDSKTFESIISNISENSILIFDR